MEPIKIALIGAGLRWTRGYHSWVMDHSDKIEIVAVAEPKEDRLNYMKKEYKLSDEKCFTSWEPLLEYIKDKKIDGVAICTSDHEHYKPAIACLEMGLHMLLEKPMAPTPEECFNISKIAEKNNCIVMVAHVLRYTPFFSKIRELIQSGAIGTIQSIQHTENIGYFHMAHSFVRGIWNNKKESNPLILSKSCHDLDILLYIMGGSPKATKVAGFGSLKHFRKENAPEGATKVCSKECPSYETECPYSVKTYLTTGGFKESVNPTGACDPESLEIELKTSRYGRCVYHCNNDVCDSMSSIIEYDNGVNLTFSLSAFTDLVNRTINIMGSNGQIRGDMEKDEVTIAHFGKGEGLYRNKAITTFNPSKEASSTENNGYAGHGGGDSRFLEGLVSAIKGNSKALTQASESVESHLIAFALEESRVDGKVIFMDEYKKNLKK